MATEEELLSLYLGLDPDPAPRSGLTEIASGLAGLVSRAPQLLPLNWDPSTSSAVLGALGSSPLTPSAVNPLGIQIPGEGLSYPVLDRGPLAVDSVRSQRASDEAIGSVGFDAGNLFARSFGEFPEQPTTYNPDFDDLPTSAVAAQAYDDIMSQWWDATQKQLDLDIAALSAPYNSAIAELQDDLSGFNAADSAIQASYKEAFGDVEAVPQVGPADALPDTDIVAETTEIYEEAEGELGNVLAKIGMDAPQQANALANELRSFETSAADALDADLGNIYALHQAGSDAAVAMSALAHTDNLYQLESSRVQLKAQFDKLIADTAAEVARKKAERSTAVDAATARANAEAGSFDPDFATVVGYAITQYAQANGVNELDAAQALELYNTIDGKYPNAILTTEDLRKFLAIEANTANFQLTTLIPSINAAIAVAVPMGPNGLPLANQTPEMIEDYRNNLLASSGYLILQEPLRDPNSDLFRDANSNAITYINRTQAWLDANGIALNNTVLSYIQRAWNNQDQVSTLDEPAMQFVFDVWRITEDTKQNWSQVRAAGLSYIPDEQLYTSTDAEGRKWTFPVAGIGASAWGGGGFGYEDSDFTHKGVDIHALQGTPIISTVSGVIEMVGWQDSAGNYIRIRGDDGYLYKYLHMDSATNLEVGTRVTRNTQIGQVGNSGSASGTHFHLHFEMWGSNGSIDPAPFLNATGWDGSTNYRDLY